MQAAAPDASNAIYYIHITCPAPPSPSATPAPDCIATQWYLGNSSLPYYDNTTLGAFVGGRKLLGVSSGEGVQETQVVSMIRGSGVHQPARIALAVTAALLDVPDHQLPAGSSQGVTSGNSNRRRLLAEDLSLTSSHQSRQLRMHAGNGQQRRRSTRRRLDENGRPVQMTLQQLAEEFGVTDMSDPVQLAHFLHEHR
jgi:hypothetical protein